MDSTRILSTFKADSAEDLFLTEGGRLDKIHRAEAMKMMDQIDHTPHDKKLDLCNAIMAHLRLIQKPTNDDKRTLAKVANTAGFQCKKLDEEGNDCEEERTQRYAYYNMAVTYFLQIPKHEFIFEDWSKLAIYTNNLASACPSPRGAISSSRVFTQEMAQHYKSAFNFLSQIPAEKQTDDDKELLKKIVSVLNRYGIVPEQVQLIKDESEELQAPKTPRKKSGISSSIAAVLDFSGRIFKKKKDSKKKRELDDDTEMLIQENSSDEKAASERGADIKRNSFEA